MDEGLGQQKSHVEEHVRAHADRQQIKKLKIKKQLESILEVAYHKQKHHRQQMHTQVETTYHQMMIVIRVLIKS